MPKIGITVTTWRAKRGNRSMRMVVAEGQYTSLRGGHVPVIVLRLCGRTGSKAYSPSERLEIKLRDLKRAIADRYIQMDPEWIIEGQEVIAATNELELSKALGRKASTVPGQSAYDFLASWYPIVVAKRVYRSNDCLETIRILRVLNQNAICVTFTAAKRVGYAETFVAKDDDSRVTQLEPGRSDEYVKLSGPCICHCEDEASFRSAIGQPLLAAISRVGYARLVRNGDNSDAKPSEYWDDGYDLGGSGPKPPIAGRDVETPITQLDSEPGVEGSSAQPIAPGFRAIAGARVDDPGDYDGDSSFGAY